MVDSFWACPECDGRVADDFRQYKEIQVCPHCGYKKPVLDGWPQREIESGYGKTVKFTIGGAMAAVLIVLLWTGIDNCEGLVPECLDDSCPEWRG